MKFRPPLLTKVLLVAFGNLLVLGVAFLLLVKLQLRLDVESFLVSPARDRILAVSRLLALQLGETERAGWDELIERYATENQVDLRLLDMRASVLAGNREPIPDEIAQRFLARREPDAGQRSHGRGHHGDYDLAFLGVAGTPARHWAAIPAPISRPGAPQNRSRTWILLSSSGQDGLFHVDRTPWIVAGCLVIAISVAFWLPFVRGLTRSISHMTAATAHIAEGHFETQLPSGRSDELGELSASIGRMASRLDLLVNGQKTFLRDAAHELRSPIARMQVALGLLERSAAADARSLVADLREDIEQMGTLIDDLLSFSRAGLHLAESRMQDVELGGLVRGVVDRESTAGVQIKAAIEPSLAVRADPALLFRALSNVLRNAVRYAGTAGPIEISAAADGAEVAISVRDCGPGVPEKELDAIFEPFHRLESARERSKGGVGLGLAIVRSAVESCHGTVRCRNRQPIGLEVQLLLPAAGNRRGELAGALPDAGENPAAP